VIRQNNNLEKEKNAQIAPVHLINFEALLFVKRLMQIYIANYRAKPKSKVHHQNLRTKII